MTSCTILTIKFTESIMFSFCILLTNKPIFNMQEVGDKIADSTPESFKKQKQARKSSWQAVGFFTLPLKINREPAPPLLSTSVLETVSPELPYKKGLRQAIFLEWMAKEVALQPGLQTCYLYLGCIFTLSSLGKGIDGNYRQAQVPPVSLQCKAML